MDKTNWKEKAEQLKERTIAQISRLIQMCKENKKLIIITVVFLLVIVAVILALNYAAMPEETPVIAESESVTKAGEEETLAVPEEALEQDVYPEVNNLVKQYYQALVDGDMDTIREIKNYTDEEEEIKIVKKSEFIESYPSITVYTKKGPQEGSYIAYVQYEVKFYEIEKTAPGLNTLYICADEEGNYYINANELDEEVVEYLKAISVQNDVVDLFNTVQVAYNEIKAEDEALSDFLDELPNLLAEAVSEAISEQEAAEAANQSEEEEEDEVVLVVTKVKTTSSVNVRSSDSIEADKVGQAEKGQILELIEERVNGWSKVIIDGKEGFIKSEYLEAEETQMKLSSEIEENEVVEEIPAADNSTSKKGKVTDTVNVRKTASTDADVLGKLTTGSEITILEQMSNGWTKIEYSDTQAYVKSDYVEVQ